MKFMDACPAMISDKQFLCGILIGAYFLVGACYEHRQSAYSTPTPADLNQTMIGPREVEGAGESAVICSLVDVVCDGETLAAVAVIRPTDTVSVTPLPSVQIDQTKLQTLMGVCKNSGLGESCAKVLYAMFLTETGGDCSKIGDQGRSYGCFQIQVKMHSVSKSVAMNLEKSATWTLNNMIGHGFKQGLVSYSIRRHNGDGPMSFQYLSKVKETIAMIK